MRKLLSNIWNFFKSLFSKKEVEAVKVENKPIEKTSRLEKISRWLNRYKRTRNIPYVKKYRGTRLLNPITKKKPYLHRDKTMRTIKKESKGLIDTNDNPDAKLYNQILERKKILDRKGIRNKLLLNTYGKLMDYKAWQKHRIRKATEESISREKALKRIKKLMIA